MHYIVLLFAGGLYLLSSICWWFGDLHKLREPYFIDYENEQKWYQTVTGGLRWLSLSMVLVAFVL